MVDAVGKPYLLEVCHKAGKVCRRAVAFIVLVNFFEGCADGKVVFSVLVGQDVATVSGSLGKVINELLLLE